VLAVAVFVAEAVPGIRISLGGGGRRRRGGGGGGGGWGRPQQRQSGWSQGMYI